jgi:hypothetical protein
MILDSVAHGNVLFTFNQLQRIHEQNLGDEIVSDFLKFVVSKSAFCGNTQSEALPRVV